MTSIKSSRIRRYEMPSGKSTRIWRYDMTRATYHWTTHLLKTHFSPCTTGQPRWRLSSSTLSERILKNMLMVVVRMVAMLVMSMQPRICEQVRQWWLLKISEWLLNWWSTVLNCVQPPTYQLAIPALEDSPGLHCQKSARQSDFHDDDDGDGDGDIQIVTNW